MSGILLVPVLVILRLLEPLLTVRLCVVGAQRFGHLSLEPEVRLCLDQMEVRKKWPRRITLWSFGRPSMQSNRRLVKLWKDEVGLAPGRLVGGLIRAGEIVPQLALERAPLTIYGPKNILDQVGSVLQKQVAKVSTKILQELGVPAGRSFVCLIIRDGSYYSSLGQLESSGYQLVNFDVRVFSQCCAYLVSEGFTVVRVGTPTPNLLEGIPGVIDYANSSLRSEVNDLVLMRECSFVVSTQTGPDSLALALRKQVLYIDTLIFSQFFFGTRLATWNPVKYWPQGSTRASTLREICESEFLWMKSPDNFQLSGFTFQRSSSEEIMNLAKSFVRDWRGETQDEVVELRAEVNQRITKAFGSRGQQVWGDASAKINGWWLGQNKDWFLG